MTDYRTLIETISDTVAELGKAKLVIGMEMETAFKTQDNDAFQEAAFAYSNISSEMSYVETAKQALGTAMHEHGWRISK